MAETETTTGAEVEEFLKPDPSKNPRNIALNEIAQAVRKQHVIDAGETMPSIDDDGNITEAPAPAAQPPTEEVPAEEPASEEETPTEEAPAPEAPAEASPAEAAFDPNKTYKVKVDGQEVEVLGSKILDAGFRTLQKETAADFRLQAASEILRDARAQKRPPEQPPAAPAAPAGPTNADLARALQFGTAEEAQSAVDALASRGVASQEQLQSFVTEQTRLAARDEFQFQEALKHVQTEYADLMANDYLRRLFFVEENRRRTPKEQGGEGDARPYLDLYKSIGEDLRKAFKMTKPTAPAPTTTGSTPAAGTAEERRQRKAEVPPVPKTAASRLEETEQRARTKTTSEVIAAMAAQRGQNRLNLTKGAS